MTFAHEGEAIGLYMRLEKPELTEKAAAEGRNGHSATESDRRRNENC